MSAREVEAFPVHQELDVVPTGRLMRIALSAIGIALVAVFFAALVLETNTGGIRARAANGAAPRAAGSTIGHIEQTPILGAAAGLDLRRDQRRQLSRYRWVDRDGGFAAIPIERGMDLFVERSR
jgi:hypothetical protein